MFDIVALGELLIDLTQTGTGADGVPQYAANPGGAPANLAVAASRLGASTAFVGKVGADAFGHQLREVLTVNGVDTSGLSETKEAPTTLAVVSVAPSGERDFSFYRRHSADVLLQREDVPVCLLADTRFFHFGSVSLTTDPAAATTLWAAQKAKDAGAIITYDPNYRERLWPDRTSALKRMREPLPLVDILKISDEELPLLTGTEDLEQGTAMLAGPALITVTLGAEGVFYRMGKRTGQVSGVPCQVGDTNGAGDTFFGALLSRLAKLPPLPDLTIEALEAALAFANHAASLTTSRRGAIPAMPSLKEMEEPLAE